MLKEKSCKKTIAILLFSAIFAFTCAVLTCNIGRNTDIVVADSAMTAASYRVAKIYEADKYDDTNYLITSKYGGDNSADSTIYGYVRFGSNSKAKEVFPGFKTPTVNYSAALVWTAPENGVFNTSTWKATVKSGDNGVMVAFVKGSTDTSGKTTLTSMITGNAFGDYQFDGFWITVPANSSANTVLDFSSYIKSVSMKKGEFLMVFGRMIDGKEGIDRIFWDNANNASIAFNNTSYKIADELNTKYVNHFSVTNTETTNVSDINHNGWSYKFVKTLDSYTVTEKVEGKSDVAHTVYEGDDFTLPAAPTVDGKVFVGWDIGNDALKSAGDKISVTANATITAVCVDFSTDKGAYFRLVTDSTGIRFDAKIKTSDKTALAKYGALTFGMNISSQTSGLEEGGLDLVVSEDKITANGDYSVLRCALVGFFEEGENTESKFYGIDLYNAEFTATAYVKITTSNGAITVETNASDAKSVAKMSHAAFNDYKEVSDEDYAYSVEGYENKYWQFDYGKDELDIIKGFADKYIAESNSEENA